MEPNSIIVSESYKYIIGILMKNDPSTSFFLYKGNDSYLGNTPFPNFQLKKDYVLASKFDSIEEARDIINSYKEDIKRCSANTLENDFEFTITKLQTIVGVKAVESVEF